MTPERWRKIEELYNSARQDGRGVLAGGAPDLLREVERLLEQESEGGILDQPAADLFSLARTMGGQTPGPLEESGVTEFAHCAQLGPYRVEARLGVGGMGEVFRAVDTRLGRIVAIKTCHEQFSERFRREARAISSLNHPHICTLYDVGPNYLVMELVEGETLAACLRRGKLSGEQTIEYGSQIADALAAAHAKDMVHRDIKPGNIMITPRGQVKVLDFGVAKLNRSAQENLANARTQLTSPGVVIGTLAYMSPEQTRGEETDARSDIFSLCVTLYEAVTGQLPFHGQSTLSLLHAIATAQAPKASTINKRVPKSLDRVLSTGMEKDPAQRFQNAGELADELRRLATSNRGRGLSRTGVLTSIGAVIALAFIGWWAWQRSAVNPVGTLPLQQITSFVGGEDPDTGPGGGSPALSSDGRLLAFIHHSQVWVKLLPSGDPTQVTRDPAPKFDPAFSPDGGRIAYSVISRAGSWDTWVIPTLGGEPHLLLPNASGLRWIGPETVLFSEIKSGMHMAIVAANTSRTSSRDIYVPPDIRGMAHRSYQSPDRKWILLAEMDRGGWLPCRVLPSDGSSRGNTVGPLNGQCIEGAWSPDGRWIYMTSNASGDRQIWRQRFPGGVPQQLTFGPSRAHGIAIAPDGLSLITYIGFEQHSINIHDESGDRPLTTEGDSIFPLWGDGFPTSVFSADGSRLYYLLRSGMTRAFGGGELWMHDFTSGTNEAVLPKLVATSFDVSPDGENIVFSALDQGAVPRLWIARLDRRTAPRRIFSGEARGPVFGNGGEIYFRGAEGSQWFIFALNPGSGVVRKLVAEPSIDAPAVSPDRNWVVVTVPFGGRDGTSLVKAFPVGGGAPVVLCERCFLRWSHDQKALFISFNTANVAGPGETLVLPLPGRDALPKLPAGGLTLENGRTLPGAKVIPTTGVFPGIHESQYAYMKLVSNRNLYRLELPR